MNSVRKNITKKDSIEVYFRDAWTCRYCNHAVFFSPALLTLEKMNPGHGYYHAHNKREAMVDVFMNKWASIDHIIPVVAGGTNALGNYVTACWSCNNRLNSKHPKNEKVQAIHQVNKNMNWDGLSGVYARYGADQVWVELILDHQSRRDQSVPS